MEGTETASAPLHEDNAPRAQIEIDRIWTIAKVCHAANRAYCESIGDFSQVSWDVAPDWQRESAVQGVKLHMDNPDAGPEASHISWMEQKKKDGWKYGEVKDADKKEHPCMKSWKALPPSQQRKDVLFMNIVHALLAVLLFTVITGCKSSGETKDTNTTTPYVTSEPYTPSVTTLAPRASTPGSHHAEESTDASGPLICEMKPGDDFFTSAWAFTDALGLDPNHHICVKRVGTCNLAISFDGQQYYFQGRPVSIDRSTPCRSSGHAQLYSPDSEDVNKDTDVDGVSPNLLPDRLTGAKEEEVHLRSVFDQHKRGNEHGGRTKGGRIRLLWNIGSRGRCAPAVSSRGTAEEGRAGETTPSCDEYRRAASEGNAARATGGTSFEAFSRYATGDFESRRLALG